jgi:hypothetical protein
VREAKNNNFIIFLGLNEIAANYYSNLRDGFRDVGAESVFIARNESRFKYEGSDENILINAWQSLGRTRSRTSKKNILFKITLIFTHEFLTLILFLWLLMKCNVFIFGFGNTFFGYKELPVIKFFGKKIMYVFHGTDSRAPYLNGKYKELSVGDLVDLTKKTKKRLKKIERYADFIISNPSQGHLHEKKFINRVYVGSPVKNRYDLTEVKKKGSESVDQNGLISIVHSPSDPETKGTAEIRRIIKKLKNKGHNIKFIELVNVPNEEVLKELMKCDFVVDQLYSDFFITGIIREAAFLGKPSVIGGYYADYFDSDFIGNLPVLYCNPEKIEESIVKLIEDGECRLILGEDAKKFIEENSSPAIVASKFLSILRNDYPQEWLFDPADTRYPFGYGIRNKELRKTIKKIIKTHGVRGLCLEDKPQLEDYYKKIAEGN